MSDTESFASRASALLDLGRAQDAEREVRKGLASAPQDQRLHLQLTRALLMLGRVDDALEASRTAVALGPGHPYALYLRSVTQAAAGDSPGAMGSIASALRVAPEASMLHVHQGNLFHQSNRLDEALASFEKARVLDPEDPDSVVGIAGVLYDLRRNDEAGRAIAEALALDPEHPGAHRLKGLHAMRSGTSRDALDASRDAVRLDPTNTYSREQLSVAMKARNPLYRALWRYGDWLEAQPPLVKTATLLAPLFLPRVFRGVGGDAAWVTVAIVVVVGVVALTWLLEPFMNALVLTSAFGRGLLPPVTKRATTAFLGYVAVAIGSAVAGLATGNDDFYLAALGALVWSATVGNIAGLPPQRHRLVSIVSAVAGALILLTIGLATIGSGAAMATGVVVLLAGVAALWGIIAVSR